MCTCISSALFSASGSTDQPVTVMNRPSGVNTSALPTGLYAASGLGAVDVTTLQVCQVVAPAPPALPKTTQTVCLPGVTVHCPLNPCAGPANGNDAATSGRLMSAR